MKQLHETFKRSAFRSLMAVAMCAAIPIGAIASDYKPSVAEYEAALAAAEAEAAAEAKAKAGVESAVAAEATAEVLAETKAEAAKPARKNVIIKTIELPGAGGERKDLTWLGVGVDEAPAALNSQLRLDPGVGLVVTFVAPDSPAAKAGLQKNDLLVELEGQSLVLPAQLRKMVQSRKEGSLVKLAYFRGGKKEAVTATLAKSGAATGLSDDETIWVDSENAGPAHPRAYVADVNLKGLNDHLVILHKALNDAKVSQKNVQVEVQRSMEQAHKAYQDALRNASDSAKALGPAHQALEELARSGVFVDNSATVTVRSTGKSSKNVVKADDSGTIVIVSNPKMRLTAHDKDGTLLFDGEIETTEQREKVPKDLWKKVEPLVEKMSADTKE
jgi:membrane-associated protease RseP (regulator of RpoE activity)